MGRVDRGTIVADQDRLLSFVTKHFGSVWASDHMMEGDRYRIEPWTQLTWIPARFPGVILAHNVLANSYRHPPLMAKMSPSLLLLLAARSLLASNPRSLHPQYPPYP